MKTKTQQPTIFKGLGLTGIALCALCCTLPIAGSLFGMGALTLLANYFEWAGIAAVGLAIIFFLVWRIQKKKARACDVDCTCKPEHHSR